ncbi:NAD-dependent dehydratase [Azospirillum sp. TSH7]|uniref:NAD-dependent epimerase/dehydratase family protein n=1 Tax=unclassified Azospirillum TaxID=2630922 RepID=UPI000D614F6A|nr:MULTISPECIES: SDR family oxidoreductase [unclassified Azospirillum]PWC62796.1 NAD-dependent dehydratase [Azospirillum sp. TSH20]PWC65196.1 NAD-dependent dehydratase [Azospirillum sp. TSH7]
MRVFVSGHHGYIGAALVRLLRRAGHEVAGADMYLYDDCTYGVPDAPLATGLRKDIRELAVADLEGFDAVMHLAGLCNDPLGDLMPEVTLEINHEATIGLARLARQAGVGRFIFSSTCSVYGAAGEDWVNEGSQPCPVTPYAVSKLRAEEDLRRLATADFSPVFLRSATAYGMSPRIRFDLVVNNLTAYAVAKGQVFLKSNGLAWRPLVHIEDISRAFIAALEAPRDIVHCEVFNVGITTENYLVREIAELVEETVPGARITYADKSDADRRSYRVDCSKIASTLPRFRPQWSVPRGIQELYESFSNVGLTVEDFEGPRFQRLAHLKGLISEGLVDNRLRWTPAAPVAHGASAAPPTLPLV